VLAGDTITDTQSQAVTNGPTRHRPWWRGRYAPARATASGQGFLAGSGLFLAACGKLRDYVPKVLAAAYLLLRPEE